eukprot:1486256-Rhodomonas_salina.1
MKIGFTCAENPLQRVRALNTGVRHAYQLVEFVRCGNPQELEGFLLSKLDKYRVALHNRELFDLQEYHVITIFNCIRDAVGARGLTDDDCICTRNLKIVHVLYAIWFNCTTVSNIVDVTWLHIVIGPTWHFHRHEHGFEQEAAGERGGGFFQWWGAGRPSGGPGEQERGRGEGDPVPEGGDPWAG